MKYKIIATDMDDTLLNSSHEISKENIQSIIEVQEKGVKFVLQAEDLHLQCIVLQMNLI